MNRFVRIRGPYPVRTRTGAGAYAPGDYKKEAADFLRAHMDESIFALIPDDDGERRLSCVAARVFLSAEDWEKYVWIEQHGSLDGYQTREDRQYAARSGDRTALRPEYKGDSHE